MSRPAQTGLTLQINSLAALERLLGGNDELSLSIRKSVASEFARTHMVDLVRQEFASKEAELKAQVLKEVDKVCLERSERSQSTNWQTVWVLSDRIKTQIREQIQKEVAALVNAEVTKQAELVATALASELDKLRAKIPNLVQERVTMKFNREVSEALDNRLKELKSLLPLDPPETRKITV